MPEILLFLKIVLAFVVVTACARFFYKAVRPLLMSQIFSPWDELTDRERGRLTLVQQRQGSLLFTALADAARMNPERPFIERAKQSPPCSYVLGVRTIGGRLLLRIDVNFSRLPQDRFVVTWTEHLREEFFADIFSSDSSGKSPAIRICEFVKNYSEDQLPESA